MPGLGLDRSDHGIRSEIADQMEKEQLLLDRKELKVSVDNLILSLT